MWAFMVYIAGNVGSGKHLLSVGQVVCMTLENVHIFVDFNAIKNVSTIQVSPPNQSLSKFLSESHANFSESHKMSWNSRNFVEFVNFKMASNST